MKVAAFGRTEHLYNSIRAIAAHGHEVVLIGTCRAEPWYSVKEREYEGLAGELKCAYFCDAAINRPKYARMVQASEADVAISVNWPTLIDQEMLDQFRHGVVNAHTGDLPRYRGNACPNWAILSGEDKVVLTLHEMNIDLDSGPILLQREFPLKRDTYIRDVQHFISRNITEMFALVIDGIASGQIVQRQQSSQPEDALRCFPRLPRDGQIDWHLAAVQLDRLVRASSEPHEGAYSYTGSERITIWRAHSENLPYPHLGVPGQTVGRRPESGEVAVLTGEGVLVLEEVETASAGRTRATEVIGSMRVRLGMDFAQEITNLRQRIAQIEAQIPGDLTP